MHLVYAAREDTAARARSAAPSVADFLCVTRRWTSCRSVTPRSIATVGRTAVVAGGAEPARLTLSPAGGGTVTLALVGNSRSALYRIPADDEAGAASGSPTEGAAAAAPTTPSAIHLRQPASVPAQPDAVAAAAADVDEDVVIDGDIEADEEESDNGQAREAHCSTDGEWTAAVAAGLAQNAIRKSLLRQYPEDAWPTLPPGLQGPRRQLQSPRSPPESETGLLHDLAWTEVDGGTRLQGVKIANDDVIRHIVADSATTLGPHSLSQASAIVFVAPYETITAVEAALRSRDSPPPTWFPSAREIADAMAPALRGVGEQLNIRARGLSGESSPAELLRKIQMWTGSEVVDVETVKRGRGPRRYEAPRLWARALALDAPDAFRCDGNPPIALLPPLCDCMPSLKHAAKATLGSGRPATGSWVTVFQVVRKGALSGLAPGGCG